MSSSLAVGGLATGIDTASLIQKLMAVEAAPVTLMQGQVTAAQKKLSVFSQINSALSNFETVANGMNTPSGLISLSTSMTDSSVATATAASSAQPGTHTIQVNSLAQSQRQISDTSYASSTDLNFNSGTITIGQTGSSTSPTTITIAEGQNSLSGIAAAINSAGASVTAALINDGTGYRLVLTGNDTNNYTIDTSGLTTPPAAPNGAAYAAPTFAGGIGYQTGAAASFSVDGIAMTRTSNSVSDVIPGVTVNLLKGGNSTTTLTVANDISGVTAKINNFVTAYNSVMTLLNQQNAYNATAKTAGTLAGDSTVNDIKRHLQSIISSAVSGANGNYSLLSSIGITTNYQDATLKVDATKLSTALNTNFSAVTDLFTHNSGTQNLAQNQYGVAQQLSTVLEQMTHIYEGDGSSSNGEIATAVKSLNDQISNTNKRISAMQNLLDLRQAQLQRRFAAMESLVNSIQANGSQLMSALNALSNSSSNSSSSH